MARFFRAASWSEGRDAGLAQQGLPAEVAVGQDHEGLSVAGEQDTPDGRIVQFAQIGLCFQGNRLAGIGVEESDSAGADDGAEGQRWMEGDVRAATRAGRRRQFIVGRGGFEIEGIRGGEHPDSVGEPRLHVARWQSEEIRSGPGTDVSGVKAWNSGCRASPSHRPPSPRCERTYAPRRHAEAEQRRGAAARGSGPHRRCWSDDDLITDVHAMHVRAHEKAAGRIDDDVLPEVFVSGGHVSGLFVDHENAPRIGGTLRSRPT